MDTLLKDERIVRDEYTRKVYLYQQRTELLEDQLGIDHVCPPKSNLVTLFDLYSTRCDVLTKVLFVIASPPEILISCGTDLA
jgi:hypothetical protein